MWSLILTINIISILLICATYITIPRATYSTGDICKKIIYFRFYLLTTKEYYGIIIARVYIKMHPKASRLLTTTDLLIIKQMKEPSE